jgi:hypothetical protein
MISPPIGPVLEMGNDTGVAFRDILAEGSGCVRRERLPLEDEDLHGLRSIGPVKNDLLSCGRLRSRCMFCRPRSHREGAQKSGTGRAGLGVKRSKLTKSGAGDRW